MLRITLFLLIAMVVALVTLLVLMRQFSRRSVQLQRLADVGLFTTGVVVKKSSNALGNQQRYQLHYAFRAKNGRRYRNAIAVAPYIWHCYDPGAAIDIAFIAKDPSINSPKYLVSEIRKMMYA